MSDHEHDHEPVEDGVDDAHHRDSLGDLIRFMSEAQETLDNRHAVSPYGAIQHVWMQRATKPADIDISAMFPMAMVRWATALMDFALKEAGEEMSTALIDTLLAEAGTLIFFQGADDLRAKRQVYDDTRHVTVEAWVETLNLD